MVQHFESIVPDPIDPQNETIEQKRHEAETGHLVLQKLSSTNTSRAHMTFRNVIRATDSFTMLNCLALTVSYSTGIIGYLVPPAIVSYVVADLGNPELQSWLSTASTVATVAILPTMSSLTDILGRKYAILIGCLLGVAGGLCCGFAPSTKVVVIGQALTGASIGFVFVSAAAMGEIVPAFTRPFWQTLQHTCGTIGQTIGPVYGGAFIKAKASGWRWVFYIDAILYGCAFFMVLFFYKPKSRVKALGLSNAEVARRFDYVGLFLFIGATVSFLVGLSLGSQAQYGWSSPAAIAPTAIGLVALIILLPLWEIYGARYPLIDKRLFKNRNYVVISIQTFVMGLAEFGVNVYFPVLLVKFWKPNPLNLGIERMAFSGSLALAQTLSGMVLQKTARYKWAYIFYSACLLVGPAIFAVLTPSQSIGVPIGLSIITGVGVGGATQLGLVCIQYSIPQNLLGIASGSVNTMRSLGGSIGIAIYSSILATKQNADLAPAISSAALKAGAPASELKAIIAAAVAGSTPKLTAAAHGNTAVIKAVQHAYIWTVSDAYRVTFLATIPFGIVGLGICFFLHEVTGYMTAETVFGVKRDDAEPTPDVVHEEGHGAHHNVQDSEKLS